MMNFVFKTRNFPFTKKGFCISNDEFCSFDIGGDLNLQRSVSVFSADFAFKMTNFVTQNDEFCTEIDEFSAPRCRLTISCVNFQTCRRVAS